MILVRTKAYSFLSLLSSLWNTFLLKETGTRVHSYSR